MNKTIMSAVLISSLIAFYFTGVGFSFGILGQALSAVATFALLYYAGRGGWQSFYLVALTFSTVLLSLGCALLSTGEVTGPFVTDFRLDPVVILLISFLIGGLSMLWYKKSKSPDSFATILLCSFLMIGNWKII
jgi:hypothetical protein